MPPTLKSTGTPTPTTVLTLPAEEARRRLLELLATNSNCRLPCLWGITPGSSTYQDAQNILAPLVSIADPTFLNISSNPGTIFPVYTESDSRIRTNLSFLYNDEGIISCIAFHVRDLKRVVAPGGEWMFQDVFDSETFGEQVRAYMLPQVLAEQGIPAAVLLQTSGTLVKYSGGFQILLF